MMPAMTGKLMVVGCALLLALGAGACEKKAKNPPGGGSNLGSGIKPPGAPSSSPSVAATPSATPAPSAPPPAEVAWVPYSGDDGSYTLEFPAKPTEQVQQIDTAVGPMKATMAMHIEEAAKRAYFSMGGQYTLPKGVPFDVEKGLDGGRDGMVNAIGGKVLKEDKIEIDGRPAREFSLSGSKPGIGDFTGMARIAYDAKTTRVFQAIVISTEPTTFPEVRRFLDSLHIK